MNSLIVETNECHFAQKAKTRRFFSNKIPSFYQSRPGLPHLEPRSSWVFCSPLCSCLHSTRPTPHLPSPILFIWLNPVQFSQSPSAFRLNVPSFIPPLSRSPTILHPGHWFYLPWNSSQFPIMLYYCFCWCTGLLLVNSHHKTVSCILILSAFTTPLLVLEET